MVNNDDDNNSERPVNDYYYRQKLREQWSKMHTKPRDVIKEITRAKRDKWMKPQTKRGSAIGSRSYPGIVSVTEKTPGDTRKESLKRAEEKREENESLLNEEKLILQRKNSLDEALIQKRKENEESKNKAIRDRARKQATQMASDQGLKGNEAADYIETIIPMLVAEYEEKRKQMMMEAEEARKKHGL